MTKKPTKTAAKRKKPVPPRVSVNAEVAMKPWWTSKMIWANVLAMVAAISGATGIDLGLTPEAQSQIVVGIMSVVNVVLRVMTSKGLT